MEKETRYRVVNDLQGGNFGMGRDYTIEEWREQAIEWADSDDNDELIEILEVMRSDKIINYISFIWELKFEEVEE